MTEQEQNIAIAEAFGASDILPKAGGYGATAYWPIQLRPWFVSHGLNASISDEKRAVFLTAVPDFTNDLNAMTQVIMTLCKKKRLRCFCNSGLDGTWECVLTKNERPNCTPCDGDYYGAGITLCKAMNEAFLRTAGKSKD